jgi:SAM-dependent methyltransferase
MVEAYGCETHAADLEPSHIEHLRARGVRAHPVEALPSNTFHYINAEQVFEHLVSPMDVIQRLADSLVPGGLLRVGVPNGSGIESLLVNPDWAAPKGSARSLNAIAPLEHLNCYTRDTLVVLGQQAALRPFEYPFKQFMQPLERSRFVLSAFVHLVRRPTGTSPIVFQRSV